MPATGDPYERESLLLNATIVYARDGRMAEARRFAAEHDALATRLSPHQEVHGVGLDLIVETAAGDWEAARALSARAEAASDANRDTPCQFNWRTLLMAALAHAQLGDEREARRLEEQALGAVEVSGPASREPAMLRLALLRGDLESVKQLLAVPGGRQVRRLLRRQPGSTPWWPWATARASNATRRRCSRSAATRRRSPCARSRPSAATARYASRPRRASTRSTLRSLRPRHVRASELATRYLPDPHAAIARATE